MTPRWSWPGQPAPAALLFGDCNKKSRIGAAAAKPKDGNDRLNGGDGNDAINARNGKRETVDRGSGRKDKATVDKKDKVKGCEKVKRTRR